MSSRKIIRYIIYGIIVVFVLAAIQLGRMYHNIFSPNINTPGRKDFFLYIPTGSDYEDVISMLEDHKIIKDRKTFTWAAEKKNFQNNVHPGRYKIRQNMSNNELINILRSGLQEPVNLVINGARTPQELAERISRQIETSSNDLLKLMNDNQFLGDYGFSRETVIGMFLPNTYEFWWNTNAEEFIERMYKEYDRFWNRERTSLSKEINMSRNEVITLASILINETNKEDEYRRIAGVYINRLNSGMRLQADPTIKFAMGRFEKQRILKNDTYFDSPYNTYMYAGLPPGPIAIPTIKAIDAVLRYEKHDYLYFCAREDFSGYHNFARTLAQHNKNARSYQNALNRRKILK
ncbi:MAG TPA: endolytic transglycosylase MltG [Bacteroidales bacterium]|jgi:UPF0755 protein|nr:endolytic transglycosylase MltG [Bacteroidales bacterium]